MYSVSSNHSKDFSVSTGGRLYTSPRSPLGRSAFSGRYLQPVPPMYVTEYEASFQWPPSSAYSPSAASRSCSPIKRTSQHQHQQAKSGVLWKELKASAAKLQQEQRFGMSEACTNIESRSLHPSIEGAYRKVRNFISEQHENDDEEEIATAALCKKFILAVDAIKEA